MQEVQPDEKSTLDAWRSWAREYTPHGSNNSSNYEKEFILKGYVDVSRFYRSKLPVWQTALVKALKDPAARSRIEIFMHADAYAAVNNFHFSGKELDIGEYLVKLYTKKPLIDLCIYYVGAEPRNVQAAISLFFGEHQENAALCKSSLRTLKECSFFVLAGGRDSPAEIEKRLLARRFGHCPPIVTELLVKAYNDWVHKT